MTFDSTKNRTLFRQHPVPAVLSFCTQNVILAVLLVHLYRKFHIFAVRRFHGSLIAQTLFIVFDSILEFLLQSIVCVFIPPSTVFYPAFHACIIYKSV